MGARYETPAPARLAGRNRRHQADDIKRYDGKFVDTLDRRVEIAGLGIRGQKLNSSRKAAK